MYSIIDQVKRFKAYKGQGRYVESSVSGWVVPGSGYDLRVKKRTRPLKKKIWSELDLREKTWSGSDPRKKQILILFIAFLTPFILFILTSCWSTRTARTVRTWQVRRAPAWVSPASAPPPGPSPPSPATLLLLRLNYTKSTTNIFSTIKNNLAS